MADQDGAGQDAAGQGWAARLKRALAADLPPPAALEAAPAATLLPAASPLPASDPALAAAAPVPAPDLTGSSLLAALNLQVEPLPAAPPAAAPGPNSLMEALLQAAPPAPAAAPPPEPAAPELAAPEPAAPEPAAPEPGAPEPEPPAAVAAPGPDQLLAAMFALRPAPPGRSVPALPAPLPEVPPAAPALIEMPVVEAPVVEAPAQAPAFEAAAPEPQAAPAQPAAAAAAPKPAAPALLRAPRPAPRRRQRAFTPSEGTAAMAALPALSRERVSASFASEAIAVSRSLDAASGSWCGLWLGCEGARLMLGAAQGARKRGLALGLHGVEADGPSLASLRRIAGSQGLGAPDLQLQQAAIAGEGAAVADAVPLGTLLSAAPRWDLLRLGRPGLLRVLLDSQTPPLAERVRWLLLVLRNRTDEHTAITRLSRSGWQLLAEQPAALDLDRPGQARTPGLQVWHSAGA